MKRQCSMMILACAVVCGCQASMGYHAHISPPGELPDHLRAAQREPVDEPVSLRAATAGDEEGNEGPTRITTLDEVVGKAWENSTDVLIAEARLEQARARTAEADGELWPTLVLDAGTSYINGREVSNFGDTQDIEFARFDLGVGLIYRLNLGSQIAVAQATRREQDATSLDLSDAKRRAARSAALAYHDLTITHAAIGIAESLVVDAETFLTIAQARAAAELASEADVALARAELARARRVRLDAEARWKQTSATLAALLRWDAGVLLVPEEAEVQPTAWLTTDSTEDLGAEALAARPDLEAARQRVAAAERRRAALRLDILTPDLSIQIRERALATDRRGFGDTLLAQGLVGWQLSLADIGRARRARAELRERQLQLEGAQERLLADIQGAVARIQALEDAVVEARAGLEAAEQSHRIQLARFEAGSGLGVEVIQAQNAVARARLELVDTVLRYNAEQVDLLGLIGHLDPERLEGTH